MAQVMEERQRIKSLANGEPVLQAQWFIDPLKYPSKHQLKYPGIGQRISAHLKAEEPLLLEHFHCSTPIVASWIRKCLLSPREKDGESIDGYWSIELHARHCIGIRSWGSSAFPPLATWLLLTAAECKPLQSTRRPVVRNMVKQWFSVCDEGKELLPTVE